MSMTPEPYRIAYEKALEDLSVISDKFESLNTRKRHVENLISALRRPTPATTTIACQLMCLHKEGGKWTQHAGNFCSEPWE
jgi:hypothetical protein